MMRNTLLFLLLFLASATVTFSQSKNDYKSVGHSYATGKPNWTPTNKKFSEIARDSSTGYWWVWDLDSLDWFSTQTIEFSDSTDAPDYTPGRGRSLVVINAVDSLYRWRSGAWRHLNPPGGGSGDNWGTDVVNTDATLTGDGTVGDPLKVDTSVIATLYELSMVDQSETNELQTLIIDSTDVDAIRRFTVTLSDGGGEVIFDVPQSDGNGIYDGSGTTGEKVTVATIDSIMRFTATSDVGVFDVNMLSTIATFGARLTVIPDSTTISHFDVGGTNKLSVGPDGVNVITSGADRLLITGNDARYTADESSGYSDLSLINKIWADSAYLGTFNDYETATLNQVLKWNGSRWFPGDDATSSGSGAGEANRGANLGSGEGIYAGIVDTTLQFKSLLDGYGVNISSDANEITIEVDTTEMATLFELSLVDQSETNELQSITIDSAIVGPIERFTISLSDGGGDVNFDIVSNTDDQALTIDSSVISGGERYAIGIENSNVIYLDDDNNSALAIENSSDPELGTSTSSTVVQMISGTGISVVGDGSDVTFTNTAPDQTVVLNNGTGISVTGSYPNFTIATTVVNTDDQQLTIDSTDEGTDRHFTLSIEDGNDVSWTVPQGSGSDLNIYNSSGNILADTLRLVNFDSTAELQMRYPNGVEGFSFYGGDDSTAAGSSIYFLSSDETDQIYLDESGIQMSSDGLIALGDGAVSNKGNAIRIDVANGQTILGDNIETSVISQGFGTSDAYIQGEVTSDNGFVTLGVQNQAEEIEARILLSDASGGAASGLLQLSVTDINATVPTSFITIDTNGIIINSHGDGNNGQTLFSDGTYTFWADVADNSPSNEIQTLALDSSIVTGGENYVLTLSLGNAISWIDDNNSALTIENSSNPELGTSTSSTVVQMIGGTGISVVGDGSDVTFTNTAPDQTVVLNNGTGISVTGTYPNFTIATTVVNTDDQTLTIDSTDEGANRHFTLSIEDGNGVSWTVPQGDGNGIYSDGANTIGEAVVATMQADDVMYFNYSNAAPAFSIDDGAGLAFIQADDGATYAEFAPDLITVETSGDISVIASTSVSFDIEGSTGTAGQVLTAQGDGTAIWDDPTGGSGLNIYNSSGSILADTVREVNMDSTAYLNINYPNGEIALSIWGGSDSTVTLDGYSIMGAPNGDYVDVRSGNIKIKSTEIVEIGDLLGESQGYGIRINSDGGIIDIGDYYGAETQGFSVSASTSDARMYSGSEIIAVSDGSTMTQDWTTQWLVDGPNFHMLSTDDHMELTLDGGSYSDYIEIGDGNFVQGFSDGAAIDLFTESRADVTDAGAQILLYVNQTGTLDTFHQVVIDSNGVQIRTRNLSGTNGQVLYTDGAYTYWDDPTANTDEQTLTIDSTDEGSVRHFMLDIENGNQVTWSVPQGGSGLNIYNSSGNILADTSRYINLDSAATLNVAYPNGETAIQIYGGDDSIATDGYVRIRDFTGEAQIIAGLNDRTIHLISPTSVDIGDADNTEFGVGLSIDVTNSVTSLGNIYGDDNLFVKVDATNTVIDLRSVGQVNIGDTDESANGTGIIVDEDSQVIDIGDVFSGQVTMLSVEPASGEIRATAPSGVEIGDRDATAGGFGFISNNVGDAFAGDVFGSSDNIFGLEPGQGAGFVVKLDGSYPTEGQILRAGGDGTFYFSDSLGISSNIYTTNGTITDFQRTVTLDSAIISFNTNEKVWPSDTDYKLSASLTTQDIDVAQGGWSATLKRIEDDASFSSGIGVSPFFLFLNSQSGLGGTTNNNFLQIDTSGFYFGGTGAVQLYLEDSDGGNYTIFQTGAQSSTFTYTLPIDSPNDGDLLMYNSGGQWSWEDPATIVGADINVYDDDGNVQDGGTNIDVSGDDPFIFNITTSAGNNRVLRAEADDSADDRLTYFYQMITPVDSLRVYSYDSGINLDYGGPDGSGSALTISSNTMINFSADSITATTVPSKPVLQTLWGGWGNTLSSIEGTANGDVLIWNEDDGYWGVGAAAGDGNGIYDGNGDVPATTVATLLGTFTIDNQDSEQVIIGDASLTGQALSILPTGSRLGTADYYFLSFSDDEYIEAKGGSSSMSLATGGINAITPVSSVINTASSLGATFVLYEGTANGSNYTGFTAPDDLSASLSYTLPSSATDGYFLKYNSSGNQLEWAEVSSGGNGIYGGSDVVPGQTVATLTDTLVFARDTSLTNNVVDMLVFNASSSNTVTTSFGPSLLFKGESDTQPGRDMARISSQWTTATDASREAKIGFQLGNNATGLTEIANFNVSSDDQGALSIGSTSPVSIDNDAITAAINFSIGAGANILTLGNTSGAVRLTSSNTSVGSGVQIYNSATSSTATGNITFGAGLSFTQTSGTRNYINGNWGFAPTSGTAVHNQFVFDGTFNQTGGASGITRGFYLNQTLTAVADFRGIEIDYAGADVAGAWGIKQVDSDVLNNFNGHVLLGTTTDVTGYNLVSEGPIRTNAGHADIRGSGSVTGASAARIQATNTSGGNYLFLGVEDGDDVSIGTGDASEIIELEADGDVAFTYGVKVRPLLNAQSGTSYTPVLDDEGQLITCTNASPITVTIPPNGDVAYPIGAQLHFEQGGAGVITFAPGSGVTLTSFSGFLDTSGQYATVTAIKKDTNVWLLFGNLN